MKDSELLQEVKKVIASGSEMHICTTIRRSAAPTEQKRSLTAWIGSMLGDAYTLESWLSDNGYGTAHYYSNAKYIRLAWLDWMIEQCQKDEV